MDYTFVLAQLIRIISGSIIGTIILRVFFKNSIGFKIGVILMIQAILSFIFNKYFFKKTIK